MTIAEIEALQEVKEAAAVLQYLERSGIVEPAIAAGWTRTLVAGGDTKDIDVSYVGNVHYTDARCTLSDALQEVNPSNKSMWDIEGIWNAEHAYGVTHTIDNFLLYYLNSIDSIYLASDGKLYDPTGYGFADAKAKVLRINEYDLINRMPTPSEEANVCLENCRRIAKFGWTPTARSVERITQGVANWHLLDTEERQYFINKLGKKYSASQRSAAKKVYSRYGWGFIFDL